MRVSLPVGEVACAREEVAIWMTASMSMLERCAGWLSEDAGRDGDLFMMCKVEGVPD